MWFNSRRIDDLTWARHVSCKSCESGTAFEGASKAAAWLSSARTVGCSLKWDNERNPCPELNILGGLQLNLQLRKERITSSQHGAYVQGNTHTTMAKNNGLQARKRKLIPEISPQFRLGAETRPHEVGIGSNRGTACRGEYVLRSCTFEIAPFHHNF